MTGIWETLLFVGGICRLEKRQNQFPLPEKTGGKVGSGGVSSRSNLQLSMFLYGGVGLRSENIR